MNAENISLLTTRAHRLAALVFTDIVGSVQLKSRLGAEYIPLLTRHNDIFQHGIGEVPSAQLIKHTGDGFFASFATASDAVRFALVFQQRMRNEPWPGEKLESRVGIHIGEVVFMDMAGRMDVVGLSADMAARIMSLAVGGQILLTETGFNDARQYVTRTPEGIDESRNLRWIAHGKYLFKGSDDPLEVYEVGVAEVSPLSRPPDSEKVKRVVPHDQELTLGWRPAVGLTIPGRPGWKLLRHLGDGGFGEVWLGEQDKLKDLRVFKFCFDVDRVRSLKREYVLFRLLREGLGKRADIAALYEVKLDEPPFFLESEYSSGGNLLEWAESHGGIGAIPMKDRLEFLAEVADAVAAAHSIGILHKDIKPSNILVHQSADRKLCPRLSDFGIGVLSDRSRLKAHNVTETGLTESGTSGGSQSIGTRMYSPPEVMANKIYTTKGDIYALGVMLFQFAVGDLRRPLAPGWERDVPDELLREDISAAVEGDVDRRIASSEELSHRLRSLEARRAELVKSREAAAAQQKRLRRRRILTIGGGALVGGLSIITIVALIWMHKLREKDRQIQATSQYLLDMIRQADPSNAREGKLAVEQLLVQSSQRLGDKFADASEIGADVQMAFAAALRNFDRVEAVDLYHRAADTYAQVYGEEDRRALQARSGEGWAMLKREEMYPRAKQLLGEVLEKQNRVLGETDRDSLQTSQLYAAAVNNVDGPVKAAPLYHHTLDLRRQTFGDNDPDTVQSMSATSNVLHDLGNLSEAEQLAKAAYEWRANKFGPTNVTTLPSLLSYGSILTEEGRAKEAAPLLKTLVEQDTKVFGEFKLGTMRAESAYAAALTALGIFDKAESIYAELLHATSTGPVGEFALHTLAAKSGYANMLLQRNRGQDIARAELLAKDAVTGLSAKRSGFRETLFANHVYAQVLDKLGKTDEANKQYDLAASGAEKLFGKACPITQRYADDYAQFRTRVGKSGVAKGS